MQNLGLIFVTLAYNFMSIFRMFVLQKKCKEHYLHYVLGSYNYRLFPKINGNLVLNIALTKKKTKVV